jgi:glutathione peroxidase
MASIYDFTATMIDGRELPLETFRGEVLLVVNVASRCGFTPQYEQLEAIYRRHREAGFSVLGFPCNQFGRQEPGSEAEIQNFCSARYDVTFPLFAKIDVNGRGTHPIYRYLKSACPGWLGTKAIKWNFTKFLIDRQGQPVRRFAPNAIAPVEAAVASLLAAD